MTRTTATLDRQAGTTPADVEVARQLAQLARDNEAAEREARRQRQLQDEEDRRRRQRQRQHDKRVRRRARAMARRQLADKVVTVGPLLVVNAVAVGGQVAYGFGAAPAKWDVVARFAVAVAYAVAVESVALYVAWHAHDALLLKAYGTARQLRRASYLIAALVAGLNYSHFAGEKFAPTALAVGCGLLSLLSPWLWGLHSRRASNVQLLAEGLADEAGAVFSSKRWRAFPIRTWKASRWSIEHNERHPGRAWDGYNRDKEATRRRRQLERANDKARHRDGDKRQAADVLAGDKPAGVKPASVKPASVKAAISDKPASVTAIPAPVTRDAIAADSLAAARSNDNLAGAEEAYDRAWPDRKARGVQMARDGATAEEIAAALPCSLRSAQRYVKAAKEATATPAAA